MSKINNIVFVEVLTAIPSTAETPQVFSFKVSSAFPQWTQQHVTH